jgi:hypothetical protein
MNPVSFVRLAGKMLYGIAAVSAIVGLTAVSSYAWKSKAHVYLADIALQDALDDGKVSIYFGSTKIGDYPVDPKTLTAIRAYPAVFRAGALGPDAYPDIATGQMLIHPSAPGTKLWLNVLWNRVSTASDAKRAFVVGFYSHAAGDMFGHDYINDYAGGPFAYGVNAAKHIAVESYIEKKLPSTIPTTSAISITGAEDFIYSEMTYAQPNTSLDLALLKGNYSAFSIPRVFSTLRNIVAADTSAYNSKKRELSGKVDQYKAANNFPQAGVYEAELLALKAARGVEITYKERWIADIDNGLKEWIQVSHRIALAMYNGDMNSPKTEIQNFAINRLISMAGAPDWFGPMVTASMIPKFVTDAIDNYKSDAMNFLCQKATGMSYDQLKQELLNPENAIAVLGLNLNTINTDLRISGGQSIDWAKVPAMVNTVTMIKLAMLSKAEVNNVITACGGGATLNDPNILYGTYYNSLDEDNQWRPNLTDYSKAMVFAKSDALFNKVFVPATYGAVAMNTPAPPATTPAPATTTPQPSVPATPAPSSGSGGGPSGGGGGGVPRYK